ncbi:uncharacterized protein LOC104581415 [Brachypodium distachyon]|uniref:Uncharacterized protein n=1 Tax=Brachypodium distachyon TaxID=15368 RepID=A0A0Q3JHB4_BRADI|nr:uncharacterized protein LOC104581415 [Brachypodium distachyon]KQK17186.1 hypothetical protein BRADI_1g32945v3 [Brachypodium distachyon]|eukprot:XP_010227236.1 uncharacterized protein LOC104581415 [Brachypodium distachyon]
MLLPMRSLYKSSIACGVQVCQAVDSEPDVQREAHACLVATTSFSVTPQDKLFFYLHSPSVERSHACSSVKGSLMAATTKFGYSPVYQFLDAGHMLDQIVRGKEILDQSFRQKDVGPKFPTETRIMERRE